MKTTKCVIAISLAAALLAPATIFAQSTTDIQARIAALIKQIQQLQDQLKAMQSQQGTAWCHTFEKNTGVGSKGDEVFYLQKALNKDMEEVLFRSYESGMETALYGEPVAAAVTWFQEKYKDEILTPSGLKNGTGYVGPSTRKKLNQLYGCGVVVSPPKPYSIAYPTPSPVLAMSSSITVLFPNGGERLPIGSIRTAKWSAKNIPPGQEIYLRIESTSGYAECKICGQYSVLTGKNGESEEFAVPDIRGEYKLFVRAIINGKTVEGVSNTPFNIVDERITLTGVDLPGLIIHPEETRLFSKYLISPGADTKPTLLEVTVIEKPHVCTDSTCTNYVKVDLNEIFKEIHLVANVYGGDFNEFTKQVIASGNFDSVTRSVVLRPNSSFSILTIPTDIGIEAVLQNDFKGNVQKNVLLCLSDLKLSGLVNPDSNPHLKDPLCGPSHLLLQ
jgi:type II secretory pathway pseudopilin PulG